MSTAASIPTSSPRSSRRRRSTSYNRLEAEKKAEVRAKYVTAGILGVIVAVLLGSLGVIAFGLAT